MKAIIIDKFLETHRDIRISEGPSPVPEEDEVLVQVHACGVNFLDLLYSRGKHQNNKSLVTPPFGLGSEYAGTVLAIGPSNTSPPNLTSRTCSDSHRPVSPQIGPHSRLRPGDRVFGTYQGSYASQISVSAHQALKIPPQWSFREAAGMLPSGPVSLGALKRAGLVRISGGSSDGRSHEGSSNPKRERVLIHAAASGLGLLAVQIAKAYGHIVIGTASTSEKRQVALEFGCDVVVDYGREKWWEEVLRATRGEGVHVVFDTVGKVRESLRCCAPRARVVVVGFAGRDAEKGGMETVEMNRVLLRQVSLVGYRFGATARLDPNEALAIQNEFLGMVADNEIRSIVFPKLYRGLGDVVVALDDLVARRVWGKAVIVLEGLQEADEVHGRDGKARL